MKSFLAVLLFCFNTFQSATAIAAESPKPGSLARQCSCAEQDVCARQMTHDFGACFQSCWTQRKAYLKQISSTPDQLRRCFTGKSHLIDQFVDCAKSAGQSCVATKNGPKIEYVAICDIVEAGERRLRTQAQSFQRALKTKNQKLIQVALEMGTCIKECFVHKGSVLSCFNQMSCQPKLDEAMILPVIKHCGRQIGWIRAAKELCNCAVHAGVQMLKPFCQIMHG